MQATVLVILYREQAILAIHDDDAAAWDALIKFVDQRWQDRFGQMLLPPNDNDRVQIFFDGEGGYLLASADVGGLEPAHHARPLRTSSSAR